jgi:energy-converting hydrogenase A subunit M
MDDEARLKLMKERVIRSFGWQKDIIIPFSKEFGCTPEELEDIFMNLMDMSSLEALHGTLEVANHECLLERLDADLRLPWYVGVLELLSVKQGEELKNKVANEIECGKSYDDALNEGRKDLFNLLKNININ